MLGVQSHELVRNRREHSTSSVTAQLAPPRGWLDQDAPVFHVAQRVPLGGLGRIGVFKLPIVVDSQIDEAAMEVPGARYDPVKTAQHLKTEGLLMADETGGKLQRQEKVMRGGDVVSARFYVLDLKILDDAAATGPKESSS
jgi:hypothetical protein